jgi:hypothetical protein
MIRESSVSSSLLNQAGANFPLHPVPVGDVHEMHEASAGNWVCLAG